MEKVVGNQDFNKSVANAKFLMKKTNNGIRSKKCNRCDYASAHKTNFMNHLRVHTGEKPNKCDQCDYASIRVDQLRNH